MKTYDKWLENYWEKTILLCQYVLKKGGRLCYIISNYGKNEEYNLVKDMNELTIKNGFSKHSILKMYNKNVNVNIKQEDNHEKICIFTRN